jgi:hypothetical protein
MPTKRDVSQNATKTHVPDWSLSEQQRTAVDLLVASGCTLQDAANSVGVTRETVSAWVNHHYGFQAALNVRRQELWQDLTDTLRALAPKALAVLAAELEGDAPLQAAVHILRCLGIYGSLHCVPRGATDPRILAAAAQSAEDEAQSAAEAAAVAAKRQAHYRRMDAMVYDLS